MTSKATYIHDMKRKTQAPKTITTIQLPPALSSSKRVPSKRKFIIKTVISLLTQGHDQLRLIGEPTMPLDCIVTIFGVLFHHFGALTGLCENTVFATISSRANRHFEPQNSTLAQISECTKVVEHSQNCYNSIKGQWVLQIKVIGHDFNKTGKHSIGGLNLTSKMLNILEDTHLFDAKYPKTCRLFTKPICSFQTLPA